MLFKDRERIVFIGDSISDFNRKRPVGDGNHEATGTGYIQIIEDFFFAFYPEMTLRITNMGTNGHCILALRDRWETDVINLHPDWVVMLVGANDVWRYYDSPSLTNIQIPVDVYEKEMRTLIERTIPTVKGMILMVPYFMEPLKSDPMRAQMEKYSAVVRKLANEYNLMSIDLQAMFDEFFKYRHTAFISWDRVHPNRTGAVLIASAFLKAIGFERGILPGDGLIFEGNDRVVFIGDSITDCLRKPVGEGLAEATGVGYVQHVESIINAFYTDRSIRFTNVGIGGQNIRDIKARWDKDVTDLNPDWVVFMTGINDLFPKYGSPMLFDGYVPIDEYESAMRELIEKTLPKVKGMILMTPFYIEAWKEDPLRCELMKYCEVVKKLAKEYSVRCVELQPAFDEYLKYKHSSSISGDRVHPNNWGHLIIAKELLNKIGFNKKMF